MFDDGDEEEGMIGDLMKNNNNNTNNNNGGDVVENTGNRLSRWHHNSSRIIRVSRASGGKDRHSKVWTSKGARDRRVRLSVSTALQFYDLQDRLGYDQPSKAVEWLIKAAEESISELPSLNTSNFPSMEDESENQPNQNNPKSACSSNSNSDTSKNSSGLSLSRSELRDKARERARERTVINNTSFTDLLNSGSDPVNGNRNWMVSPVNLPSASSSSSPMEYFSSGLILGSSGQHHHHQQTHFPFSQHQPSQEFSYVPDHHQLISPAGSNGFNLDFNMSSTTGASGAAVSVAGNGFSGFHRGTLQSNSSNHHHHHQHQQSFLANLQRFSTSENGGGSGGGGGAQFLFGALPAENHNPNHHHNHQFQLYYESDQKGKGKN